MRRSCTSRPRARTCTCSGTILVDHQRRPRLVGRPRHRADRAAPRPADALPPQARGRHAAPAPPGLGGRPARRRRGPRQPGALPRPRRDGASSPTRWRPSPSSSSTAAGRCGSAWSSRGWRTSRAAIVFKMHHCAVDGVGAARMLGSDVRPRPRGPQRGRAHRCARRPPRLPSARARAARRRPAHRDGARDASRAHGPAAADGRQGGHRDHRAPAQRRRHQRRRHPDDAHRASPSTARSRPGRTVAYVDVPLGRRQGHQGRRRRAPSTTPSSRSPEAPCAATSQKRDELPDSSLIAVVPVSRPRGRGRHGGQPDLRDVHDPGHRRR